MSENKGSNEKKTPQGAMAISLLYILLVITLWSVTYLTLLSRGATQ